MYNAANNASSQLATSIGAEDTSLAVLDGSSFPEPPFVVSIEDEIIEVGAKDGNTFSALVRGTEGTTPASHASGSRVENRFTAGTYTAMTDMLDALAGVRIVEMGSNSNGEYVRWENGLQVCWHVLQSTQMANVVLSNMWTFPASFASAPVVLNFARLIPGSYRYAGSATPHLHFGFVSHTNISNGSVTLAIYRTTDTPDFQSGDYVTFSPIAIGRWK